MQNHNCVADFDDLFKVELELPKLTVDLFSPIYYRLPDEVKTKYQRARCKCIGDRAAKRIGGIIFDCDDQEAECICIAEVEEATIGLRSLRVFRKVMNGQVVYWMLIEHTDESLSIVPMKAEDADEVVSAFCDDPYSVDALKILEK